MLQRRGSRDKYLIEQPDEEGGCLMNVREQLRQDWASRIADYKASGLTMSGLVYR